MTVVYKLLQSGFIGGDTSDLIQLPIEERNLAELVSAQSVFRPDTTNFYDKAITQLYFQTAASPNAFSSFAFRETILKKAFEIFHDDNWSEFFLAQSHSPAYTYLHERFLKETISFIFERKQRTMGFNSYFRMLHVGGDHPTFTSEKREESAAGLIKAISKSDNGLTLNMINQWTSTVNGLQDLIGTLNVIFGRRPVSAV